MPPNTTYAPRARTWRPISYPRRALPVWIPMPTTSPGSIVASSSGSSVSSTMNGSPHRSPVAAASTYSQRGVITATPKDCVLGLTRWIRGMWLVVRRGNRFCGGNRFCRGGRGQHLALGDFLLRRHRHLRRLRNPRRAAPLQLPRPESGQHDELEGIHVFGASHHDRPRPSGITSG